MYKTLFDGFIKNTISDYDLLSEEITNKIEDILSKLSSDAELIEAVSMPGLGYSGCKGSGTLHDIEDTYDAFIKLKNEQELNVRGQLRAYVEKQETMNRIIACYNALPEDEHRVLEYLYEKNKFKEGLRQLIIDTDRAKATILRRRTSGIEHIKQLYNTDLSNLSLYKADINKNNDYR